MKVDQDIIKLNIVPIIHLETATKTMMLHFEKSILMGLAFIIMFNYVHGRTLFTSDRSYRNALFPSVCYKLG